MHLHCNLCHALMSAGAQRSTHFIAAFLPCGPRFTRMIGKGSCRLWPASMLPPNGQGQHGCLGKEGGDKEFINATPGWHARTISLSVQALDVDSHLASLTLVKLSESKLTIGLQLLTITVYSCQ